MIELQRNVIYDKVMQQDIPNDGFRVQLQIDAYKGRGDTAMAYLVKRGEVKFSKEELRDELNDMVENNLLTIGQHEQMIATLEHAKNGIQRITNFLKKKRRIKVVG